MNAQEENTPQAVFNYVVQHLYKQGKPAQNEEGGCMYRTEDGLMCAVGCLIPDIYYRDDMEWNSVYVLMERYNLPEAIQRNFSLLSDLQDVHDNWPLGRALEYVYRNIEGKLVDVANEHNLVYKHPGE